MATIKKAGGGPGSRGGTVLGRTTSGKPIYARPNHPEHASFTPADHRDAAANHMSHARMLARGDSSIGHEATTASVRGHWNPKVKQHVEAADLHESRASGFTGAALPKQAQQVKPPRGDVTLGSGRVVKHTRMANGAQHAEMADGGTFSHAEAAEYDKHVATMKKAAGFLGYADALPALARDRNAIAAALVGARQAYPGLSDEDLDARGVVGSMLKAVAPDVHARVAFILKGAADGPKNPGSRGGQGYRTASGAWRYGFNTRPFERTHGHEPGKAGGKRCAVGCDATSDSSGHWAFGLKEHHEDAKDLIIAPGKFAEAKKAAAVEAERRGHRGPLHVLP